MKAFKGKTYTVPIEKDRKEEGKYKEKLDMKYKSGRRKIAKKNKEFSSLRTNQTHNKNKKLSLGDDFLIGVIIGLVILFVILLFSLILNPMKSNEEIPNKVI